MNCPTILAVDPGSRLAGYGVLEKQGSQLKVHSFGLLTLGGSSQPMPLRLALLHEKLLVLFKEFEPQHLVLEKAFMAKDALAALKLGQARGVVLMTAGQVKVPVFEYSPNEVKKTVTGYGHASKEQVAKMVSLYLGQGLAGHRAKATDDQKAGFESSDVSDALALGICHLQTWRFQQLSAGYSL